MHIFRLCFALLALLSVTARMTAQTSTITRSLSGFEKIAISGGYDAIVFQEGDAESVTLEVEKIDPDKIITEVKGNTLEIRMKKGSYSNFHARITVTYRRLNEINNSGSTDLEAKSTIKGASFELNSSGSGDFKASFDVQKLAINISGSSNMEVSGRADRQNYAISGSGDIDADNLSGKEADVAVSGSGDVRLKVDGPVHTAVSGSGEVTNTQ
ncbi:MAG: head GIN domain-containing protein [Saprospiraceae bacterium]